MKSTRLATLTDGSYRLMGIDRFKEAELSDIPLKCTEELKRWVTNIKTALQRGYGLYLWGDPCSGKSYTAAAVLKSVAKRRVGMCRFYPATELRNLVVDFRRRQDDPAVMKQYDSLRTANVLVIDSIGSEKITEHYKHEFKAILLARRSQENCVTIFTSTIDPTVKGKRYLNSLYDDEICELIFGSAYPVEVSGGDFKKKVQNEMAAFFGGG